MEKNITQNKYQFNIMNDDSESGQYRFNCIVCQFIRIGFNAQHITFGKTKGKIYHSFDTDISLD